MLQITIVSGNVLVHSVGNCRCMAEQLGEGWPTPPYMMKCEYSDLGHLPGVAA